MAKKNLTRFSESGEPRALFKKKKRHPFISGIVLLLLFVVWLAALDFAGIFDASQALHIIVDADALHAGS